MTDERMREKTKEALDELSAAMRGFIGESWSKQRPRFKIGSKLGETVTVTGPTRIPRKLKKRDKKAGILRVTVGIQVPCDFLVISVGFNAP